MDRNMVSTHKKILISFAVSISVLGCKLLKAPGDDASASALAATAADKFGDSKDPKGKGAKAKASLNAGFVWSESPLITWKYTSAKMDWASSSAYCDQLALAQKKKWRLPVPAELQRAMQSGISSSKNPSFGWVYLNQVWSSSWENAQGREVAMYLDMSDGNALRTSTDHELSTLCVVTTNASGRSDIWTDEATQLVWRDLGQQADRNATDARCHEVARTDRLPWRMPSAAELDIAVKNGIQSANNIAFGQNYITISWASDRAFTFGQDGVAIDLRNGNRYVMALEQPLAGLCVRPKNH